MRSYLLSKRETRMSTFESSSLLAGLITGIVILVIAVVIVLGNKANKNTKAAGLAVVVIAAVLIAFAGVGLYAKSSGSQDKSQIYQDILGDNSGMQITALDTGSQSITYIVHGQQWPVCVARYSQNDKNHYVVDAESVMCQKNVPQSVRDAQKNAASTTAPPTSTSGNTVLPSVSTTPPPAS